jgi:primosomal protein N' (replication factor Y)
VSRAGRALDRPAAEIPERRRLAGPLLGAALPARYTASAPLMLLADVAVPVPLARPFTYSVPAALAASVAPGARVVCELGRRRVVGVVLEVGERERAEGAPALKPIAAVVDPEPVVGAELLRFLLELAAYYFAPVGEVLRLALPALERGQVRDLRQQGALAFDEEPGGARQVGGRRVAFARPTDALEAPGTLRGQAAAVLAVLRANGEQPVARLAQTFGGARAAVKKLVGLGLVAVEEREPPRDPFFQAAEARDAPPELNAAQAEAAARIAAALAAPGATPRAFLLFGVTGSGKTEVYLRAIAACRAAGRGALVMVPEIALTPQLVSRFRARFGDDVAVLHSALGDADRHAMWKRLRSGELSVAIGARSALFAPIGDLGLVIVDEEHDGSFKQEEGVRYNARDMALLRAHRAGAVCVLGSATPSLESVALVDKGKVAQLDLPDRAVREASLPAVTIIDLRRIGAGPTGNKLVSLPLHRAIEDTLRAGEQAIIFLNRRGFAPSVVCEECGTVETCKACSVALTYHRGPRPRAPAPAGPLLARVEAEARARAVLDDAVPDPSGRLRCHYCDFVAPVPPVCSACGRGVLALEGLGTERLEATLAEAFPAARVARLDRDVADGPRSQAILDRMRAGAIDILVGTQMVTKGHDLPNVTLVGVVNADAALSLPDFRAAERGFQLLVQVAGRAGRRDRPGRVLIQTRNPEHHAVRFAAKHDVAGFLARELVDRREVDYPPFSRLALVRVDAPDEAVAREAVARLAAVARRTPEVQSRRVEVLGPAVAPIARLRGRFRFRLLVRARDRAPLRAVLGALHELRDDMDRSVRVALDVDPVAML